MYVKGYGRRKAVDKSAESGIINTIQNASGKDVTIVNRSNTKGTPNSITQIVSKKGGISRNYYDETGKQYLQITNNDHGHKKESGLGKHGEHAHDYFIDENGNAVHGEARELTESERKENEDII